jgi:hypothetical protein
MSKKSTGQPDRMHLHQLIAIVYVYPGFQKLTSAVLKNSITGFLVSLLSIPPVLIASIFFDRPPIILGAIALFIVAYWLLYRWIFLKSQNKKPRAEKNLIRSDVV